MLAHRFMISAHQETYTGFGERILGKQYIEFRCLGVSEMPSQSDVRWICWGHPHVFIMMCHWEIIESQFPSAMVRTGRYFCSADAKVS